MKEQTQEKNTPKSESGVNVWAVVVAAGRGARYGGTVPKQYVELAGVPLVIHSLNALCDHPDIHGVFVGLAPTDSRFAELNYANDRFLGSYHGGAERFVTVIRGLEAIYDHGGGDDWVLIHDAARPLVTAAEIDALLAALTDNSVGAVLGLPVVDAMKRSDDTRRVIDVVARDRLWRAVTPQAFRCGELLSALTAWSNTRQSGASTASDLPADLPLDECEAMQRTGTHPVMVVGRNTNIKITTHEDLALAQAIYAMAHSDDGHPGSDASVQ